MFYRKSKQRHFCAGISQHRMRCMSGEAAPSSSDSHFLPTLPMPILNATRLPRPPSPPRLYPPTSTRVQPSASKPNATAHSASEQSPTHQPVCHPAPRQPQPRPRQRDPNPPGPGQPPAAPAAARHPGSGSALRRRAASDRARRLWTGPRAHARRAPTPGPSGGGRWR